MRRQSDALHPGMPYAQESNDMKLWTSPSLSLASRARYAIDSFNCLLEDAAAVPPPANSSAIN